MKTTKSYPAMHSNDTFWFAVDKEGKVGYFDAPDSGEIPAQGCIEECGLEFFYFASKEREGCLRDLPVSDAAAFTILQAMKYDMKESEEYSTSYYTLFQLKKGMRPDQLSCWPTMEKEAYRFGTQRAEGFILLCLSESYRLYLLINETNIYEWDLFPKDKERGAFDRLINVDCKEMETTKFWSCLGIKYYTDIDGTTLYSSLKDFPQFPMVVKPPFPREICVFPVAFEQLKQDFALEEFLCALARYPNDCREPYFARREAEKLKTDEERVEALFKAIGNNDYSMVAVLLEMYDVSPLSKNKEGITAIAFAEQQPRLEEDDWLDNWEFSYKYWGATILQMLRLVERRNRHAAAHRA
jgi:hypothetical protein